MTLTLKKVTIYRSNEMLGNVTATEAHLVSIEDRESAGKKVLALTYIPKRARKPCRAIIGDGSLLVILEGWDQLKPADRFEEALPSSDGFTDSQSRYSAFDPRWKRDFADLLNQQSGLVILHKSGAIFQEKMTEVSTDAGNEVSATLSQPDTREEIIRNLRAAKSEKYNSSIGFKAARFSELSESSEEEGNRLYNRAREMGSVIPFGQPIHVGHYSEKADRRYRDRIHNTYGKSFEAQKRAEYYSDKAAKVGSGGISSSDGDAVSKLEAELQKREERQALMKRANTVIRKLLKKNLLSAEALKAEFPDYPDRWCEEYAKPGFCGIYGYARFEFSNNNANIKRLKDRISVLKAKEQRQAAIIEETGNTFSEKSLGQITLTEDFEENRIQIRFPRQGRDAHDLMRSHGFVWSGRNKAYQRQLNNSGRHKAKEAVEKLQTLYPALFKEIEAPNQAETSTREHPAPV